MASEKRRINHLAVITATVLSMAVGFFWYLEPIFGGYWMDVAGIPRGTLAPALAILLAIVFNGVVALGATYTLAAILKKTEVRSYTSGAGVGFGLGFVALTLLLDGFYAGRPPSTFLIDAGFLLISFTLMGAILGGWQRS